MSESKLDIRYCKAANGLTIAWAMAGSGPALVHCIWAGKLTFRLVLGRVLEGYSSLGRGRTVVHYDGRGTGLSDRNVDDISVETAVEDLEAVVAAAGLDRFAIIAAENSCHPAIHYAARNPERVTRLILTGGYARGHMLRNLPPETLAKGKAILAALEAGLTDGNPGFRLLNLAHQFPSATPAEIAAFEEYYRATVSGRDIGRFTRSVATSDVSASATLIRCPTLVIHSRGDVRNPLEEGRRLATLIPGARFLPVDSENHFVLPSEPAFAEVVRVMCEFLDGDSPDGGQHKPFPDLSPRQRDVLELLAQGLDNLQIAARLALAEKTVRNTITPLFQKLSVESRPQAIVRAREAGFGAAGRPG